MAKTAKGMVDDEELYGKILYVSKDRLEEWTKKIAGGKVKDALGDDFGGSALLGSRRASIGGSPGSGAKPAAKVARNFAPGRAPRGRTWTDIGIASVLHWDISSSAMVLRWHCGGLAYATALVLRRYYLVL